MKKIMLVLAVCLTTSQLMAQSEKGKPVPPPPPVLVDAVQPAPPPPPPPPPEMVTFTAPKIVKNNIPSPPPRAPKAPKFSKKQVRFKAPVITKDKE